MTRVVGVDPGKGGAVACVDGLLLAEVADMPATPAGVADLLTRMDPDVVVVERVAARPGQGVASMFTFGRGVGVIEGVCGALCMRVEWAPPSQWRPAMVGRGAGKAASRARASELWPGDARLFARPKDDGRAEAALIAEWWRRRNNGKA